MRRCALLLLAGCDGVFTTVRSQGTGVTLGVPPPYPSMGHALAIDGVNGAVDLGDQFGFPGTAPSTTTAATRIR